MLTLESERVKIVKSFIKMIKDKNTPWYPVSQDHLLLRKLSQLSSWAECLDKDDYRFLEQIVDGVLYYNSNYSKELREKQLNSFATVLEAYAERPRPPKRNIDYCIVRRKKYVQKMGTVVSALSSKPGLIPFPEKDLELLKQLFSNAIRE
jgi:hypothetical protein